MTVVNEKKKEGEGLRYEVYHFPLNFNDLITVVS